MAQLKSGSTIGGTEIADKNLSNVTTLPAEVVTQLKGDTGATGPAGANVTATLSGTTLYITD